MRGPITDNMWYAVVLGLVLGISIGISVLVLLSWGAAV